MNKGTHTSRKDDTVKDISIGLQDHDEAIMYYFNNVIRPSVIINGDRSPVPIIYGSPERWKGVQNDGYFRDKEGKIQVPLIMFKRDSIEKRRDLGNKLDGNNPQLFYSFQEKYTKRNQYDNFSVLQGRKPQKEMYKVVMPDFVKLKYTCTIWCDFMAQMNKLDGNNPQLFYSFQEKYTKRNQYDNFSVLQGRKPQKEMYKVVIPDFVRLKYTCTIWCDFMAQMNKLVEMINYSSDSYWGDKEKFQFYDNITEIAQGDNRVVKTNFGLEIQGYLVPDSLSKKLASENTKKAFTRSVVSFGTEVIQTPTIRKSREEVRNAPFIAQNVEQSGEGIGFQIVGKNTTIPTSKGVAGEVSIGTAAIGSTFVIGNYKNKKGMDIGTDFIIT
jgi:hypothetical protein